MAEKGRSCAGGRRGRGRPYEEEKKEWIPKTELGKEVKSGKIKKWEYMVEKKSIL